MKWTRMRTSTYGAMTYKELNEIVVRGSVIIYLTNGGRTIEATIKSPDIDILLPFTPREIMEAALEGKLLTEEVQATLRDKHVICFLKYYDQKTAGGFIRRYPILKVYKEADVNAYNANASMPPPGREMSSTLLIEASQDQASSSATIALTSDDKQFFSPTTKNILESIMEGPSLDDIQSDCSVGVKRMLDFEDTPDKGMNATNSGEHAAMSPNRTPKTEDALPAIKQELTMKNKHSTFKT